MAHLAQITDDAFPGAKSIDFIGQMVVYVEPFGRYWGWSNLADANSWNSLDSAQAETAPDRIQGLIVSHNEVLLFGERTIEPWALAPTETATFQLQTGSVIESGCASGRTLQRLDNAVFYLTNNGQVARLDGYTPRIVSTVAIESAIRDCNWGRAFAFTWEDSGHAVYYITFPDGHTWGYDVRQNRWHRRESYGLGRWRINTLVKSNGKWIAGDFQNGRVYELEWGNVYESCEIMPRKLRSGVLHSDTNRISIHGFRLVAASGDPSTVAGISSQPPPINNLLVTGQAATEGGSVFAMAQTVAEPEFTGLATGTGANLVDGIPAFYDNTFVVAGNGSSRVSQDNGESWNTVSIGGSGYAVVLAGGPAGWALSLSPGFNSVYKSDHPPTAWSLWNPALNDTAGTTLQANIHALGMLYSDPEAYWLDTEQSGFLVRTENFPATIQAVFDREGNTGIVGFIDFCEFNGAHYALVSHSLNGTEWLVRSDDEGATWGEPLLITTGAELPLSQLCPGNGVLLVLNSNSSTLWTSADNFSVGRPTGLTRTTAAVGRQMAYGGGYFYIVGRAGGVNANARVLVTPDGIELGDPIALPISSVRAIASSYVAADAPVPYENCTPMEGGTFQLRYSDDGGHNYTNWRDFPSPVTGRFLPPLVVRRLGMTRQREWEFLDTSNRPQDVLAASIIAE